MEQNFKAFSIEQLNNYAKNLLLNDVILSNFYVVGEVVGLKSHYSGHMYFSLKDENASINCVMFKGSAGLLPFSVENGMKVIVGGRITLYEKTGSFQIICNSMKPFGYGELQLKIDQLKEKLLKSGYFSNENKLQIPVYPKNVAIITSDTGSVLQDILNVSRRRNKSIKIFVYHTKVQGENANLEISEAIDEVNKLSHIDLIILARGGGSFLDLLPFNSEEVANSIFKCKIPLISAVGHETDFSISDMVADLRCATPTEAGEVAFPLREEMLDVLDRFLNVFDTIVSQKIIFAKQELLEIENNKFFVNPDNLLKQQEVNLQNILDKLNFMIDSKEKLYKNEFVYIGKLLEANSPVNNILKGYSVTMQEDKVVKKISDVKPNDKIVTKVSDGTIFSKVEKVKKE
ncbi:MAG: exodeoxyribonuclease VII large subunit [Lachnospirales bacterium]